MMSRRRTSGSVAYVAAIGHGQPLLLGAHRLRDGWDSSFSGIHEHAHAAIGQLPKVAKRREGEQLD